MPKMPLKRNADGGIQISLAAIFQVATAVVLGYLLTQVLGAEARMRAIEVKIDAHKEMCQKDNAKQDESIKSLWNNKQSKKDK